MALPRERVHEDPEFMDLVQQKLPCGDHDGDSENEEFDFVEHSCIQHAVALAKKRSADTAATEFAANALSASNLLLRPAWGRRSIVSASEPTPRSRADRRASFCRL